MNRPGVLSLPNRRRAGARGLSMIELLVTVTILGLLLVAVMPSIGNWMRNTEIRNAAESIQNGLTKARAEAVKRNEVITFSLLTHNSATRQLDANCALSSSSGSWVVSKDDPSGKCADPVDDTQSPFMLARQSQGDGSPNVTVSVKLPAGTDPCKTADTSTSIAFNGYGRVVMSNKQPVGTGPMQCIVVEGITGTHKLNIVVGSGGTVRMCDPAATDANDPRHC
jgi:type IV fimbrial biogenesis protein FimT